MNLLNSIFDLDWDESLKICKRYVRIFIIVFLILVALLVVKKDYYYDNVYINDQDKFLLLVEKDIVSTLKKEDKILINDFESKYSINSVIDNGNNCYLDINLIDSVSVDQSGKYKIYLGKETFLEYIIRIMKKN